MATSGARFVPVVELTHDDDDTNSHMSTRLGHLVANLLTFFCASTPRSGGLTTPQSNTGYEPNSELDMAGKFVSIENLRQDDEDRNCHMADVPLQIPASASVALKNSALVAFSQAEDDFMRIVRSLQPIPSQTGVNPWQFQCPSKHPQGSPAVLGLKNRFNWLHKEHEKF